MGILADIRRFPDGCLQILAVEGRERFGYYGLKSILYVFLLDRALGLSPNQATTVVHGFTAAAYALTVPGGWLGDAVLGHFFTIVLLGLAYACSGAGLSALAAEGVSALPLVVVVLAFAAFSTGGLKACTPTLLAGQFGRSDQDLQALAFSMFYLMINGGSILSTVVAPLLKHHLSFSVAFAIPSIATGLAVMVFFAARSKYRRPPQNPGVLSELIGCVLFSFSYRMMTALGLWSPLPPASIHVDVETPPAMTVEGSENEDFLGQNKDWSDLPSPTRPLRYESQEDQEEGLHGLLSGTPCTSRDVGDGGCWLDVAVPKYGEEFVGKTRKVLSLLGVFLAMPVFWSLYDLSASRWVAMARGMDNSLLGFEYQPRQLQVLNPLFTVTLIPLFEKFVYPWGAKHGMLLTPLPRMAVGMFFASLSFFLLFAEELLVETSDPLSVPSWLQLGPYFFMSCAEVLVAVSGLYYAQREAPHGMKGVIVGLWYCGVSLGNMLILALSHSEAFQKLSSEFLFLACLQLRTAFLFSAGVRRWASPGTSSAEKYQEIP